MTPKKLWFNLHYDGRLAKNFFLRNVLVKSVCSLKDGPPIYFKEDDQPLSKHVYLKKFVQTNAIKFQRCKKVEVTFEPSKEIDKYFDKSTSKLWFNGKHLTETATNTNPTPKTQATASTRSKITKKSTKTKAVAKKTPKKATKVKFSPSDHSKQKTYSSLSKKTETHSFYLKKHMEDHGFSKFHPRNMDLYHFLNAYELGCKKSKLTDEEMVSMLLFFLDSDCKKEFLELQIYRPTTEWNEFRIHLIEKYHEPTYKYCWKYLSASYSEGSIVEFARKKSEVIRKFCKSIPDKDLIIIINWSLPLKVQQIVMPKLIGNLATYFKELDKLDAKKDDFRRNDEALDQENENCSVSAEELENMEIVDDENETKDGNEKDDEEGDEEEDEEDEEGDEKDEENNGESDAGDESDPGFSLFK